MYPINAYQEVCRFTKWLGRESNVLVSTLALSAKSSNEFNYCGYASYPHQLLAYQLLNLHSQTDKYHLCGKTNFQKFWAKKCQSNQ